MHFGTQITLQKADEMPDVRTGDITDEQGTVAMAHLGQQSDIRGTAGSIPLRLAIVAGLSGQPAALELG
jgi:hypothetical protein